MAATEREVHKNRRKPRKKRFLSALLAASLLIPSVLIPGKNTVEGAGHANIDDIVYYYEDHQSSTRAYLTLSDGRKILFRDRGEYSNPVDKDKLDEIGADIKKYISQSADNKGVGMRLMSNGDFYYRKDSGYNPPNSFEKIASGWTDFVYNSEGYNAYTFYGLTADGRVEAIGSGTYGQLGNGIKADTTVPVEVVDPDLFDTPLTGVKKMIQVDRNVVLFVTDSDVYKIGREFGDSSYTNAKPVKVTSMFPGFSGPSTLDMGYIDETSYGTKQISNTSDNTRIGMRYFEVNGSYYTLRDTSVSPNNTDRYTPGATTEISSKTLYPFNGDPTTMSREVSNLSDKTDGSISRTSNTFMHLDGSGNLNAWGLPASRLGADYYAADYTTAESTVMTNLKKYTVNANRDVSLVAGLGTNGNVYVIGSNGNTAYNGIVYGKGITGIEGRIETQTRLSGPDGAIKDITDLAFGTKSLYLLKNTGDVYVLSSNAKYTNTSASGIKFVGLLEIALDLNVQNVYGIGSDGNLYRIDENGSTIIQDGASGIYPPGYTPAPTTIDKPTEGMRSTDKFENTIITLEYPAVANKKEYSLDNGATWLDYNAPITLSNKGMTNIKARAGLDSLYSEILDISFLNNPIVIPAGYPKLLEQDGVLTVDTGAIDLNRVKVQLDVDGQLSDYTSPILLQEGDYVVSAIVSNQNGEELTRVTENITVDPPAPGTLTAPVGTVGDLDANNQRPLTIGFNPTQGSLQIQHDGGPWVDEPEILNQYNGTSEDPSATERKFTLFVDNVVDSVYKARVTDGVNFSSETLLVVTAQVYDPSFFRDIDDKLLIDFSNLPTGNWYKEYSVDQGSTYHEYTGPIDIGAALPIKVRVTDTGSGQVLIDKEYITPALNGTNPNPNPNPGVDPSWGTEVTAADQEAILNVIGGGLSSKFNGLLLDNIEIQTVNQYQTINSVTNTLIEDSSGSGDGWTYSLSVTDFVSDPVLDTGLGTQDLVVKIPSSAMNVDVKSAKVLAGSPDQTAKVGNYVLGNQKQALAQANPFEGMGYYDIPMDFMFRVPSTVEVVSMGSGSAHQVGDKVGLRVGVYRSLFTFSLAKGI
ncbi:hypothetical protein M2277_006319 [Paenibacillus sp. LBL]|uniref:hypothetical protein n=1 Tax=Paenibacillus sp. LBL TaxID=2940563 RepID=UPI00247642B7|nr:hypothetical protein [Paenibacillus sp. LBL]MDH6675611.1 hypothetical protein [Paenibacillus sp. LBL]